MEKITREDIMKLRFMSDPVLSPDGKHTAYVVHNHNLKADCYEARLFVLDNENGTVLQLTDLGKEGPAIWLDKETVLFATERGPEDKAEAPAEKTCFYRMNIHGGEAMKAFEVAQNVLELQLLEDGRFLMMTLDNLNPLSADLTKEQIEEEKDYHVLEEIPFYANARGYISRLRRAVWVLDAATGDCEKLSPKYLDVQSMDARNSRVVFTGREYDVMATIKGVAYLHDLKTGKTTSLVEPETWKIMDAKLTEDAVLLMMTDNIPWGMSQSENIYRYDLATGEMKLFCRPPVAMNGWMSTDAHRGGGTRVKVSGGKLYYVGQNTYRAQVYAMDVHTGETVCAVPFDGCVNSFDVDEQQMALCASAPDAMADLYLVREGVQQRMTGMNDAFLADKYVAKAKYIPFTDSDGVAIDGWVLEPKDYDPSKRYPGVLEVHGGPRGTYGEMFQHQHQMLASDGYFVFFCNPRGGEGYGEAFADLRGRYGTIDYQDLMEFTDHVLALYPALDPHRLGETGISYGGFMSNWIEGHTDRFGAIVSCCSISNWVADFAACEFGYTFDANEMAATPWDGVERMWEQSPLKYANQAKTPILFMQCLCDYNTPVDQGREMFIAMKYFGVPSRMVLYEGENHGISSNGKPKHKLRNLLELKNWFDKYLKAAEA